MLRNFTCFLYNGINKIPGFIQLNDHSWIFTVAGFEDTGLTIVQNYQAILNIQNYKLYNLETCGLKITDINGNENIIIMDQYNELKSILKKEVKHLQQNQNNTNNSS